MQANSLKINHGLIRPFVFAHRDRHSVRRGSGIEVIRFDSSDSMLSAGIGVDGDEEIRVGAVCYCRTFR